MKTMIEPTTKTIQAPGATITYDVRRSGATNELPLMIIGSPMGAASFVTLVSHFPDRTVVTYDPRGADRSTKDDPTSESTPEQHADDLHRIISEVGGPVDLFASSGGAVNALALVARHPQDVRLLIAHEPPTAAVLPDGDAILRAQRDIHDTYMKSGFGAAMAKFINLVMQKGEIPGDFTSRPAPDPQMFHLPTEDDGSRGDALLGQNMLTCSAYQPDFEALRAAPTRIVVAVGEDSAGETAHRGGEGVASQLGLTPVVFPGGHGGFLGGEYGQTEKPDEFAAKLREVLTSS